MTGQEAFWQVGEVRLQAAQAHGQLDVWDMLLPCEGCGAAPAELCNPFCTGLAATLEAGSGASGGR